LEAEVYGLTRFLDDPGVREKIERRIHEYLGKAKWHSSVLAEKPATWCSPMKAATVHPITIHNLSPAATPNQKMAAEVHIAPLRLRSLSAANFASLSTTRCVRVAALPIATA
jgi:hypothetical protein